MDLSRRDVLAALGLAPLAMAGPALHHRPRPSVPPPAGGSTRKWFQNGYTVGQLYNSYPSNAAWAFNQPSSYVTDQAYDGLAATVVQRFTSYATFASQVGSIAAGTTVLYDNENWADTPQAEIDDPWTYMADFASLAHSHSLIAAVSPARDLGNDPTSKNPKRSGESLDGWYLRTGIGTAAGVADIYVVQTQVDTTTPSAYLALFNGAYDQALAISSSCKVFAELSHNYGTAAQAYAAATQTGIRSWAGIFYSGANDSTSLGVENDTLQLFRNGGY